MEPIELLLRTGEVEVEGRMPWSSNATFLVTVTDGDASIRAIYKPLRGERPLWDFPSGLHKREVAAYELSEAMGFHVVPLTVERDGPLGVGSFQLFIEADFEQHYFTIFEQRPELHDQLRRIAAFDIVANNTDRKGGHCLLDHDGKVWAIDNGLCFAVEPKLRTVIWEFAGDPIDTEILDALLALADHVPDSVAALLAADEVEMIAERARRVASRAVFPHDRTGRAYPWPLV
jgi:uncharacterized repeat protein (TIGR03843 family)